VFGLLFLCAFFYNRNADETDLANLHGLKLADVKPEISINPFYQLNQCYYSRNYFLTSFLIFVKNKMPFSHL